MTVERTGIHRAMWVALGLITLLVGLFALGSASTAATSHRSHHHKKHKPHRQAAAGPLKKAHVRIVRAPMVGGKGGGVDPGDDYPSRWKNIRQDSVFDQWGMYNRECTSFVAWALYSRNGFGIPFYDNANRWGADAAARGYVVNSSPAVGSVAWSTAGSWGHVAYVVAVGGGNVTIEEYNHYGNGTYSKRTVPVSNFSGYIHFRDLPSDFYTAPPAPAPSQPAPAPSQPAPAPSQPAPPRTYAETTGGVTHTWTNYTNAGGTQGPSIASNTTVQITCKVTGFRVEDGNTWWYRIASSPWNNSFYASADAFYNNGQTSGSLKGTPFVDPAVPSC